MKRELFFKTYVYFCIAFFSVSMFLPYFLISIYSVLRPIANNNWINLGFFRDSAIWLFQKQSLTWFLIVFGFIVGVVLLLLRINRAHSLPKTKSIAIAIARYSLAFIMLTYALTKFTGGQFPYTYASLDAPARNLPDFYIVWYLFGKSWAFTLTAAILEFIPALLLLWRKTYFIGAIALFPILAFINVVNWYYNIGPDIHYLSRNLLIINLALILNELHKLRQLSRILVEWSPSLNISKGKIGGNIKLALLITLFLWFGFSIVGETFLWKSKRRQPLYGAYFVTAIYQNGKPIDLSQTQENYIRTIYLERVWQNSIRDKFDSVYFVNASWGSTRDSLIIRPTTQDPDNSLNFALIKSKFYYDKNKNNLTIEGMVGRDSMKYVFRKLNLAEQDAWPYAKFYK